MKKLMGIVLVALLCSCVPTPTPGLTPTCNPWPTFWPTDLAGPPDWGTPCTPTCMPTARNVAMWPTCTLFPAPEPLAIVIQDACLRANGQPIILDRSGPIWQQARQMFEGCPLGPEITVVTLTGTYHAQRFLFGYLFYRDGAPDEMWYMTHLGWQIHAVVPCVCYNTTPVWSELPMIDK